MGLKEAAIYLDNPYNTYYAGQTINGRVEYVFDSPKKVRGIHVLFRGEAHTSWSETAQRETEPGKQESVDTHMIGHEEYFNIQYYVLGSKAGEPIEIPPGKQVYNFTCTLPPVLPSAFEGDFGYVRYTIKVTLDRPWKFDQETKMAFTVINQLDLNLNPSYKQPLTLQMEKSFCCLCCASAPLSVDVQAPVSGYCPGQVIPLKVDVENNSNVQVHLIKVFLRKLVTYRETSPSSSTKKTEDIIKTLQEGPVPAGSTKQFLMNLEVPSIPPSNLVNCSIIDLDYDIMVECAVSGAHVNLKAQKYVTIGTIPLVMNYTAPSAPSASDADPGWKLPDSQHLYPQLSAPVYQPSMYAARTIQDKGDTNYTGYSGEVKFAPYYPTYAAVQPPPLPQ